MEFKRGARGAAGQQYAIVVGLIAVVALLGVTRMGGGVNTLMTKTGNVLTQAGNGVTGSGTTTTSGGGGGGGSSTPADNEPDPFSFPDGAAAASSLAASAIVQLTGHTGVTATISGTGSPQFRVCADATCTSVVSGYSSSSRSVANNQYVQIQVTTPASTGSSVSATLTAGSGSAVFTALAGTMINTNGLKTVVVSGQLYNVTIPQSQFDSCDTACSGQGRTCNPTKLAALQSYASTPATMADLVTSKLGLTFDPGPVSFTIGNYAGYFGLGCTAGGWGFQNFNSPVTGCNTTMIYSDSTTMSCSSEWIVAGQYWGPRMCVCD